MKSTDGDAKTSHVAFFETETWVIFSRDPISFQQFKNQGHYSPPLPSLKRKEGKKEKKLRMNLNICTPSINSDFDYSSVPAVITRPLSAFHVGPSLLGLKIRKGEKRHVTDGTGCCVSLSTVLSTHRLHSYTASLISKV